MTKHQAARCTAQCLTGSDALAQDIEGTAIFYYSKVSKQDAGAARFGETALAEGGSTAYTIVTSHSPAILSFARGASLRPTVAINKKGSIK